MPCRVTTKWLLAIVILIFLGTFFMESRVFSAPWEWKAKQAKKEVKQELKLGCLEGRILKDDPVICLEKEHYRDEQELIVRFYMPHPDASDWVSVVPARSANTFFGTKGKNWKFANSSDKVRTLIFNDRLAGGEFEARLYANYHKFNETPMEYKIMAFDRFTVTDNASRQVKKQVAKRKLFN